MEEEHSTLPITCNICKRKFSQKEDISSHIKFAHFGMRDAVHEDTKVIDLEDDNSIEDSNANNDMEVAHFGSENSIHADTIASDVIDLDNDDDDSTEDSDDNNDMTIDFGSLCKVCYNIFRDDADLEVHTRLAHPKSTETDQKIDFAKTPVVNNNVDDEAVLMENDAPRAAESLVTANEEDTDKDIDDEVIFDIQTTASMDVNWHENYERAVCNICVEEFENKATLSTHIKSAHFGISSYKCAMCSKSFESRDEVIKHYNVCTGENQNKKTKRRVEKTKKYDKKKTSSNKPRVRSQKSRSKTKKKPIPPPSERAYVKVTRLSKQKLVQKSLKCQAQRLDRRKRRDARNVSDNMKNVQSKPRAKSKGKVKDAKNKGTTSIRPCSKPQAKSKTKVMDPKNKKMKSLSRPCFICRERYVLGTDHMSGHGYSLLEHLTPDQESNIASLQLQIKFKCLRCGKVGSLLTIQNHLQESCMRGPLFLWSGVFFCTICGEMYVTSESHDEHVASEHYSHLYRPDSGHFAHIPFPHILVYYVSPNVCQHCGKMCNFTINGNSTVTCIAGPYICPYAHTIKQSRCTLDLLMFHTKSCARKLGVLALQCNNCFKMLLCNSSPEQVDQLKEVINLDNLECCGIINKSFKCYCCNCDFTWKVITRELRKSIQELHDVRQGFRTLPQAKRILSCNPSIHGKSNPIQLPPMFMRMQTDEVTPLSCNPSIHGKSNPIPLPHMFKRMQTDAIRKKLESKAESISPLQEDNIVCHQPSQNCTVSKPSDVVGPDPMPLKITNVFKQKSEALTVGKSVQNSRSSCQSIVQSKPTKEESRAQAPTSKKIGVSDRIANYGVRKMKQNDLNSNNERQPVTIRRKRTAAIITECKMVDDGPAMMALVEENHEIEQYIEDNCAVQETTSFGCDVGVTQPNATIITDCNMEDLRNAVILEEKKPHSHKQFAQIIEESCTVGEARGRVMNTSIKPVRSTIPIIINMTGTNAPDNNTVPKDGEAFVKVRFCKICSKHLQVAFYDEESFLMHMLRHELSPFGHRCYDCNKTFGNRQEWKLHIKFQHPQCFLLKCHNKGCSEEFQRPQDLQAHMMSEHYRLFGCTTCLHMFSSEEELQVHYTAVHGT